MQTLADLERMRSAPQEIPRHWMVVSSGQIARLDRTGEQLFHETAAQGVIAEPNLIERPVRPAIGHFFEGEFIEFETEAQVPRDAAPQQVIDPKTGRPKWHEGATGVIEFEYCLLEPDERGYRPLWMADAGVTQVIPLTDDEHEQMRGWSKSKRLKHRDSLHFSQPENRLPWTRPHSEWKDHGLKVPRDYEPPQQPEPEKEQLVSAELKDLMSTVRQQQKQIDGLMKQLTAKTAEADNLRKAG